MYSFDMGVHKASWATHSPETKMAVTSHGWLGEKVAKLTPFHVLVVIRMVTYGCY